MHLSLIQYVLGLLSGGVVGLSLGLVGGGGSILAVPLMVYLVGVPNPHLAIGTSAFAVAANAASGLVSHARGGMVKWRCGMVYAAAGVIGALAGSTVGKLIDGEKLLFLFAMIMVVVALIMRHRRHNTGRADAECTRETAPKLVSFGFGTGILSGFFGIGGGFLIVPGLIASTDMPIVNAIGSSLVAVTAFGLTTALNYSLSGLVDWPLAFIFILGGIAGSLTGCQLAKVLSVRGSLLSTVFSTIILVVAAYMLVRSAQTAHLRLFT
jgi:uncharacterized protein